MALALGVGEDEVLAALAHLKASGAISRVGAVIRPNTVGVSTLAAMAVPAARLEEVAVLVSGYPEVNHNYEREHRLNLWFVAAAPDAARLAAVLDDIGARTGLEVLAFPMLADYHIDLGFDLRWT
jgi:DNA-binding Lrp family transcriptional regulator